MQAIGGDETPGWAKAKNDAVRLVDDAMAEYENKSMGSRKRPDDPNLYAALQAKIADALFVARQ